ncbi:MAG: riboflavin biosynthesis protein RibF, partial [Fidelibacterota bacterium]
MVVYKELNNISILGKSVLTMGTFDGIHLGHREVLAQV